MHLHEWVYGAHYEKSYNNRLEEQVKSLQDLGKWAHKNNIQQVVFGGDLFHTSGKVTSAVLDAAYRAFKNWPAYGLKVTALVGNHDQATRDGTIHAMQWLEALNWTIVSTQHRASFAGHQVRFLAFTPVKKKIEQFLKDSNDCICFLHQGVNGAALASGYVLDEVLTKNSVKNTRYTFTGHYHQPVELTNTFSIIGSFSPLTWSDANAHNRGWIVYDTDSNTIQRHTTNLPKFIQMEYNPILISNPDVYKNNYIRITIPPHSLTSQDSEDLRSTLLDHGAHKVELDIIPDDSDWVPQESTVYSFDKIMKEIYTKLDKRRKTVGKELQKGVYAVPEPEC